ncbi:MAG: hypothetical protein ACE5J5_02110 [Candidatus Hydrothermarchaeales archaeon]
MRPSDVGGPTLFVPSSKLKETKNLDQNIALKFALAVKEMNRAVFLMGFGIVWIFTTLFILVLDKQTFMILLKETWPIMIMVFPMMFFGYKIAKLLFEQYPINPSSTRKSRHSRVTLRYSKPEESPLKL